MSELMATLNARRPDVDMRQVWSALAIDGVPNLTVANAGQSMPTGDARLVVEKSLYATLVSKPQRLGKAHEEIGRLLAPIITREFMKGFIEGAYVESVIPSSEDSCCDKEHEDAEKKERAEAIRSQL